MNLRQDVVRIAVLIVVAALVRFWLMANTEVLARDSVDFIRIAARFETEPLDHVLNTSHQAPGYPALIVLMARLVRSITGEMTSEHLAFSAQLVSVLCAILTVIPMYLSGRTLLGHSAGFFGALVWQALPVCVRVTSDGLSEGSFFLFFAWALFFGISALRSSSVWRFLTCGALAGMAYLVRPEGGEILVAVGLTTLIVGLKNRSVIRTGMRLTALAAGVLPFVGWFYGTTGYLTRKPTSVQMFQVEPRPVVWTPSPMPMAAFWTDELATTRTRTGWAVQQVLFETNRTGNYGTLLLAGIGCWLVRRRLRMESALWPPVLLIGGHLLILWRMATVSGYVSERHAMITAFAATFFAGGALSELVSWLASRRSTVVLAALLMALSAPSTFKPLHANRAGHHAAGRWLATHATSQDEIVDPFAWARFYAGDVKGSAPVPDPAPTARTRYVVMEQPDDPRSRLHIMAPARALAHRGKPVYHWPPHQALPQATIVIYRVSPGQ